MDNMKMVQKKILLTILSIVLIFTSACSSNTQKVNNANSKILKEAMMSEEVQLKMYLLGDAPRDYGLVLDELNKLIKRDLNASLNVEFIPWGDYVTKYPVLMSSSEKFDLIYTSEWAYYKDLVQKGSFLSLDDLLDKYAPNLSDAIPSDSWNQTKYKGSIYMVPANFTEYSGYGFAIRGDLRKKYSVPIVDDLDSLEEYFDAILANEKEMLPYNAGAMDKGIIYEAIPYKENYVRLSVDNIIVSLQDVTNTVNRTSTKEYKDFLYRMRRWQQKGYWSKDMLSNKNSSSTLFENGKSASTIINNNNVQLMYSKMLEKQPTWELEYFDFDDDRPGKVLSSLINDGMAINRNSQNPERSIMLLDKLHNDENYYDLTSYGIRGKHYDLNSEKKIILPDGLQESENGFAPESACSWGWRENKFYKTPYTSWEYFENKRNNVYSKKAIVNPVSGFVFDANLVSAEVALTNQVLNQYQIPLIWGMTDPESGLKILEEKLSASGSGKILQEVQKQWSEYINNQLN